MRKIEQQMNAAISSNINWKSANTEVVYNQEDNTSDVFLHGNHIATVGDDYVMIYDGGWQSTTTKSRLNAICSEHCIAGEGVFQKNYQWFVRVFTGAINGKSVFTTKEFSNGYCFAWFSNFPLFH